MQKIFSQEIRFKADDGSEFPDWENCSVNDCLVESKIKGGTGRGTRKLTVKLWNKGVKEKQETIEGSESTQYFIRRAGQFIYSKLDFLNCAFGIVPAELDGYQSTIDLPCFDFKENTVPYYFLNKVVQKNFYEQHGEKADGSRKARRINQDTFLAMPIKLPCKLEQEKITLALSAIDEKIQQLTVSLEANKTFKKGLLQQMFV